ncbi:DNA-binding protein [Cytobacillus oceanisediminis]|uniref:DNA-binding protein n=1 Tax=Cytobacillus oceanisediminis TaxID=665099 RepID=UPI0024956D3C|nr:DNA-binding protein [Cytobacillus oceanisediminis]
MPENNLKGSRFPEKPAQPAVRALEGAGYFSLEQLAAATEAELLELHGMGPNAMEKLRKAMADNGLSFKG